MMRLFIINQFVIKNTTVYMFLTIVRISTTISDIDIAKRNVATRCACNKEKTKHDIKNFMIHVKLKKRSLTFRK